MIRPLLRWGVPILVVASLALPAARLTWHAMGDSAARAADLPPPATSVAQIPVDLSPILALAPFGSAQTVALVAENADDLALVLNGVATSSRPEASSAFIEHQGTTLRYGVGDAILEAVTLTAVARDHVRLDVAGEARILAFADADVQLAAADAGSEAVEEVSAFDRLRAMMGPARSRKPPPRAAPETIEDHIDLWRDRIRRNPQDVLDEIGLVAGPDGYTIAEQHDLGVAKIGLRPGDLVTRVNGAPVGNVDTDRALYDDIASSGMATVEIERDGDIITMSFPLR